MRKHLADMKELLQQISECTICVPNLDLGPRPILSVDIESKIIVIGQAPGIIVHESGAPWDDKSGDNLRKWMDVDNETFYNPKQIALIPMGFCYPGKGKSGDLAPRKECAPLWHQSLLTQMKKVKLVLLVGKYAQDYYLQKQVKKTLTETVRNYRHYLPKYIVLPHPSPRNNIWQAKNDWFKLEVIPELQLMIKEILK
ncbi:MAG: uracil-DNA glycosylase family protein [Reichenbachiella sp.]